MKITALEEYGLRCMVQLALGVDEAPMTVAQVAEREGLSTEYAGKLLNLLGQAGLVRSVRGRNGGFTLARPAEQITLAQIVRALSHDLFDTEYCERHSGAEEVCVHQSACTLRPVWSAVSEIVGQVLESFTLMDLLRSEGHVCRQLEPHMEALAGKLAARHEPDLRPRYGVRLPDSH